MSKIENRTAQALLIEKKKGIQLLRSDVTLVAEHVAGRSPSDMSVEEIDELHVSCCGLSPALMTRLFGTTRSERGMQTGQKTSAASSTAAKLQAQIESLSVRAAFRREEALSLYRKGDEVSKKSAMRLLKKAKTAEVSIQGLQAAQDRMEMQADIQMEVQLNREIATALGKSSKKMIKTGKDTLSKAEDAVDASDEVVQLAQEVSGAMDGLNPASIGIAADEDDLLRELDELCNDAPVPEKVTIVAPQVHNRQQEARSQLSALPSAPVHIPERFLDGAAESDLGGVISES